VRPRVFQPLRRGLAAECQQLQPPQPVPGDPERHHSQHQADNYPDGHALSPLIAAPLSLLVAVVSRPRPMTPARLIPLMWSLR
jgi:hypothetical protein